MRLDLTQGRKRGKLAARITDGDVVVEAYEFDPMSPRAQDKLCKVAGIGKPSLHDLIAAAQAGHPATWDAPPPAPPSPPEPFRATLRAREGSTKHAVQGVTPEALLRHLDSNQLPLVDPILEWGGDRLAVLDVDYHDRPADRRPALAHLRTLADRILPRPFGWRISKNGGLHLYYQDGARWKGVELASVAAVSVKSLDPWCTVEVKTRVIRAPYQSVTWCTANDDIVAAVSWLRMPPDAEAVQEFIEERGWTIGRKYPHSHCPINPGYASHGDPVYVGELGVFCHSCNAHGPRGLIRWASLVGRPGLSVIGTLIRNYTHWTHARLILGHVVDDVPSSILEQCYRVLLRSEHGDDPETLERIDAVFYAGNDLIRAPGRWVTEDFSASYRVSTMAGMLKSLPGCTTPAKLDLFRQDCDLTDVGYPPVENVVGCRISGHYVPRENAPASVVTLPAMLKNAGLPGPQYLPPERRRADWGDVFRIYFPRIDLDYLQLLIAAKGIVEAKTETPMILATGPSGSAKSATVGIASAVTGDVLTELVAGVSQERLRQCIVAARGVYCVCNEVFKHGRADDPIAALNPVLTLTPDSTSHVLYVGPVQLGYKAVVFTDTTVPQDVSDDVQIARRLIHVQLPSRLEWDVSLREHADNRPPGEMRLFSEDARHAADTLLSIVIDRFFAEKVPAFVEIAEELGFATLESSPFIERPEPDAGDLYALFLAVCEHPIREGGASNWKGRGWKHFSIDEPGKLPEAWTAVRDSDRHWWRSRRVSEADWGRVLGLPFPVRCDVQRYGRRVGIRFTDAPRNVTPKTKVNEELLT